MGWRGRHIGLAVVLAVMAGCVEGSPRQPRSIEDQAWREASVDHPRFELEAGPPVTLTVHADTSLPIDDARNRAGFTDRVQMIVWRTRPELFDELQITTLHDGETVDERTISAAELEELYGPRPDGLDAGQARTAVTVAEPTSADWEPYAGGSADEAVDGYLAPLLERTVADVFGITDVEVRRDPPRECYTGMTGDTPTGTFSVDVRAWLEDVDTPGARFVELIEYWRGLGFDVDTTSFDGGRGQIGTRFGDVGGMGATLNERTITIGASTECLEP